MMSQNEIKPFVCTILLVIRVQKYEIFGYSKSSFLDIFIMRFHQFLFVFSVQQNVAKVIEHAKSRV